ncbi:MAG TPA: tetratricopeptide repeat protein [Candidatus Bathyarchaeia archaeon]|jgi:TolB-like protein/Flp pilus assembly protein TadD|nr:tetratricopeptide repeat protein [Candidatus Bathyarchaeia archaeon]
MAGAGPHNREQLPEPHISDRLDSWKEIAAYLKRDERTVRRWEEREGLPVHRHQHKSRSAIFAYKSELDSWWDDGRKRLEGHEQVTAASPKRQLLWLAVAAAVLLSFGVFYVRAWLTHRNALVRVQAIAILPLENLSQDSGQDYLADGLTEALTTDLGKLRVFRVISRTSTMRYKGTKKSVPEIARELNVDAIVEGAVLRSGNRVRITAQLIQAPTDSHVWAETYDRDLRDVLDLQADVARAIAAQIRGKLSSSLDPHGVTPLNPEAYELYLKGRYARDEGSQDGLKLAFEYFRQVLEKDPGYAPAYAGLADSYARLPFYSETRPEEAFPKAKAAAVKALQLDPTLAEAHASMAYVKTYYDWDWAGAEAEFRRGLELNPNNADVHHSYSRFLASLGRIAEARGELKRAQELDPLSLLIQANAGVISYFGREYDQAIQELRAINGLDQKFHVPDWGLGLCYEQKGMYEEAITQFQKAIAVAGRGPNGLASIGHAYGLAGQRSEARKILVELEARSKKTYVSSYQIALVYLGLRQNDQAMKQLENAYREHSTLLTYLKMDPRFDPLRSDSRFRDLLGRIGLHP